PCPRHASPPQLTLCPYTTLFRSLDLPSAKRQKQRQHRNAQRNEEPAPASAGYAARIAHSAMSSRPSAALLRYCSAINWPFINRRDRKSTRLNSSHVKISYAVFCW